MILCGIFVPLLSVIGFCTGAPTELSTVDMTHVFDNSTLKYPTQEEFQLEVLHNGTHPDGYWLQIEQYYSGIHVGTHIDAPCHCAKGRWCVDDIPLNRLIAPVAVIDITKKAFIDRDAFVEVEDLENWELLSGQSLDGTIVMIHSGWGSKWNDKEAYTGTTEDDRTALHSPGVSGDAADWLVNNRAIYGLGIDTLSLDNGQNQIMESHQILLGNNIFGLENVANTEEIPIYGATLYVMPMKIGGASGAPVRIIATFPRYLSPARTKAVIDVTLNKAVIQGK